MVIYRHFAYFFVLFTDCMQYSYLICVMCEFLSWCILHAVNKVKY